MIKFFLSVFFIFCAICSFAQWTTDPSKNTVIISGDSSDIYPLSATTTDGFTYVSWYASTAKVRYEMRMQLIPFVNTQHGHRFADESFRK